VADLSQLAAEKSDLMMLPKQGSASEGLCCPADKN